MASEASYVYILSGQKLIINAKNGQFWKKKIEKFKWDIFGDFQTMRVTFFCKLAQKTFFTLSCSITRVLSTESFLWSHFPLLAFWDEIVYWNLYLIVIREFWHLRGGLPERDNFALFVHFFVFFVLSTIYIFYWPRVSLLEAVLQVA